MKISKIRIKNYRSIKDSGEINFIDKFFVLAGQNESGKSSILEALESFEQENLIKENLNFELENEGNLIQSTSITYTELNESFYESILKDIFEFIKIENKELTSLELETVFKKDAIKKVSEFTITKTFDFTSTEATVNIQLDKNTLEKITACINQYEIEDDTTGKIKKSYLNTEVYSRKIAETLWKNSLDIILFNSFTTILPDRILLEDINKDGTEGIQAVKNIEKLLRTNFESISKKSTPQKNATTENESNLLSANFQEDWQQKIYGNNHVNIKFFIENNELGKKEISFYVETRDNEFLAPRRRSKGMIWFLSLWLELKACEDSSDMLILFDEPGLHLHVKANKDMLKVFHKLNKKGHQIIYSTHSPSLIEVDNLQNIGLVVNGEKDGTTVEALTSSKFNSSNKKDALQPISEAMGLQPLRDFSIFSQKNVLVEGLSDFWILKGVGTLLGRISNFAFIPAIGIKDNKINPLISFCVGYGLEWLLILDGGENPKKLKQLLLENYFDNDHNAIEKKILISNATEIENLFDVKDLPKIDSSLIEDSSRSPIEIIGKKRKIIFSKLFYQKIQNGSLKKSDLKSSTLKEFEKIFDWIEQQFNS
jgi:predicted ATP-dependent endonuclease of OLD family